MSESTGSSHGPLAFSDGELARRDRYEEHMYTDCWLMALGLGPERL